MVGAYGIRPTEWPRRGQECASAIDHSDHSPHKWVVCRAYAIRPYMGTRKRAAVRAYHNRETIKRATVSTSHPIASPKGSLFFVFHLKTHPDRDHFLAVRVGAYCIRPTKWPRRGQKCASVIDHLDHSPHKWVAGGAYSIRPYTGTQKRTTFSTSHPIASPKRSPFFG